VLLRRLGHRQGFEGACWPCRSHQEDQEAAVFEFVAVAMGFAGVVTSARLDSGSGPGPVRCLPDCGTRPVHPLIGHP